jgi:hypothetical protein
MEAAELQAKATIAAALIASHVITIDSLPKLVKGVADQKAIQLRALTDYVYLALIGQGEA